jgi:hypothetical protein
MVFPSYEDYIDYNAKITDCIKTLAQLYKKSEEDIVGKIRSKN